MMDGVTMRNGGSLRCDKGSLNGKSGGGDFHVRALTSWQM